MKVRIEIVAVAILILAVAFGLDKCSANKKLANQLSTIDSLALANQGLTAKLNKANQVVSMQTVIVTDNQQTIKELTDSIFNLKRRDERKIKEVIAYWRERTKVGVDSVKVPYVDTVRMKRFSDSVEKQCVEVINYMRDSTITVPRTSRDTLPGFAYDITATRSGLVINHIEFPDSLDMRFVEKGGFLKKKSIEVQFKHTNPNVKVVGSSSILYRPKKKGGWVVKALVLGLGVFIGTKL